MERARKPTLYAVEHPAACPVCECTARVSLRILRRDENIDGAGMSVIRRRVRCLDCREIYTLISYRRSLRENLAQTPESG